MNTGHFYFGKNKTFLLWLDSALPHGLQVKSNHDIVLSDARQALQHCREDLRVRLVSEKKRRWQK